MELQRETEKLRTRVDKLQFVDFAAEKHFFLIPIRALSDRYEDSHTKAAMEISAMKAEFESEQGNVDKILNEVA